MRAVAVSKFGGPEALRVIDAPKPEPEEGEVRVKVLASPVNPIDVFIRSGALADLLPESEYYVPGVDVAGEVDLAGPGVSGFAAGQSVVALVPWFVNQAGTYAEYVVVPADALAVAPHKADAAAASTLPLNGITASLTLDVVEPAAGKTILVTGAAGGVGGYAVQLAAGRGATVIAVAGPDDDAAVRALGAGRVVARGEDVADKVKALVPGGVDGVVDAASLGAAVLPAVRDGGRFAAVLAPAAPEAERGITVETVQQAPDGKRLAALVSEVDAGRLTLRVAEKFALADAATAHERFGKGGVRGRLVLVP
ncbi:NADP-dependent oxidoreductase [Streptomyces sp. NPDC001165]|uniref:NADP-dependent oxidoreductase n=1 Tax=Streptomyces sp. NPDC001165 TaxID=3364546 RepID=UPI0036CCF9F7